MKPLRILYLVIRLLIVVAGSTAVFFGAVFSLLSKDELDRILAEKFGEYFMTRLLVCLLIGLVFFLASLLTNLIFRRWHGVDKNSVKKLAWLELAWYLLFSLGIVSLLVFTR